MRKYLLFVFFVITVGILSLDFQNTNDSELFFISDANIAYATDPNTPVPIYSCKYKPGGSTCRKCSDVPIADNICVPTKS